MSIDTGGFGRKLDKAAIERIVDRAQTRAIETKRQRGEPLLAGEKEFTGENLRFEPFMTNRESFAAGEIEFLKGPSIGPNSSGEQHDREGVFFVYATCKSRDLNVSEEDRDYYKANLYLGHDGRWWCRSAENTLFNGKKAAEEALQKAVLAGTQ